MWKKFFLISLYYYTVCNILAFWELKSTSKLPSANNNRPAQWNINFVMIFRHICIKTTFVHLRSRVINFVSLFMRGEHYFFVLKFNQHLKEVPWIPDYLAISLFLASEHTDKLYIIITVFVCCNGNKSTIANESTTYLMGRSECLRRCVVKRSSSRENIK